MRDEEMMRAEKMAALRELDGGLPARQGELAQSLDRIGQQLEELEQRLQPVLQDPMPEPPLHGTPRIGQSPLGQFLAGAAGHANDLAERLAGPMRRVDL